MSVSETAASPFFPPRQALLAQALCTLSTPKAHHLLPPLLLPPPAPLRFPIRPVSLSPKSAWAFRPVGRQVCRSASRFI
ncbi:unnamed protein product [Protopolystoma xenopodis]|uniref:Uncharacterized protein n=1 Tax=Protopolystoma xenopodis TaxID=117903 RepID=A0A3S5CGI5_9PLAT|nr:unnamed protein product [Protopolystoma xenopodis]